MLLSRLLTYGVLGLVALIVLVDTNIGIPLKSTDDVLIQRAISLLGNKGFRSDSQLAAQILRTSGFRHSRFYTSLSALSDLHGQGISFYAYTPVLSRSRVFVGSGFLKAGGAGRASILMHELTHVRNHRRYALIGVRRSQDETMAYLRQYNTYQQLGLSPADSDGLVYWDMMIGVVTYVLPRLPGYAGRPDVRNAEALLSKIPADASPDYLHLTVVGVGALIVLAVGDRLGLRMACLVLKKCSATPLLHLDPWLLPLLILLPILVVALSVTVMIFAGSSAVLMSLVSHLVTIILVLFGMSGVIGGFLGHGAADADRPPRESRRPT